MNWFPNVPKQLYIWNKYITKSTLKNEDFLKIVGSSKKLLKGFTLFKYWICKQIDSECLHASSIFLVCNNVSLFKSKAFSYD